MSKPEKILITGTGRAGTTFLVRLMTLLKLPTGFSPDKAARINLPHNAGMEFKVGQQGATIVKSPTFIQGLADIQKKYDIYVIIPIRAVKDAAESRVKNGVGAGGLWNAKDQASQENVLNLLLVRGLTDIVQNDIPHVFIDFCRMIKSPEYLFGKLEYVMTKYGVSYDAFSKQYVSASNESRPL
jgi:hypothetical protein